MKRWAVGFVVVVVLAALHCAEADASVYAGSQTGGDFFTVDLLTAASSYIGDANRPVNALVFDPTGATLFGGGLGVNS